jgi:Uma2 family endonuclease
MKVKEPISDYSKLDLNNSYTFLDYMSWQFKERVELIKGRILKMSPAPSSNHQSILLNLAKNFGVFFNEKNCRVFPAPFDVRLFPEKSGKDSTIVQPDISVVCNESQLDKKGCLGPPDLIIEIISPGNTGHDLHTKFDLYEEAGVKEYWIVDPLNKTVLVYTLINNTYIGLKPFTEGEQIICREFPELKVQVTEVFSNMLPE